MLVGLVEEEQELELEEKELELEEKELVVGEKKHGMEIE